VRVVAWPLPEFRVKNTLKKRVFSRKKITKNVSPPLFFSGTGIVVSAHKYLLVILTFSQLAGGLGVCSETLQASSSISKWY
jgi:hypothetical protein